MSMRKWLREKAHEQAKWEGIKKLNKEQIMNGKVYPSKFATYWRELASRPIPPDIRKNRKMEINLEKERKNAIKQECIERKAKRQKMQPSE